MSNSEIKACISSCFLTSSIISVISLALYVVEKVRYPENETSAIILMSLSYGGALAAMISGCALCLSEHEDDDNRGLELR
jgi:hypothetical protein